MPFPKYIVPGANHRKLEVEIIAIGVKSARFAGLTVGGDDVLVHFEPEPIKADIALIDAAVAAHVPPTEIEDAKKTKTETIDARTVSVIERGFDFKKEVLSLSINAQAAINAIYLSSDTLEYPVILCNRINTATITIDSYGELLDLHASMLAALMAARCGGVAIKSQVIDVTTIAQVEAVEDKR